MAKSRPAPGCDAWRDREDVSAITSLGVSDRRIARRLGPRRRPWSNWCVEGNRLGLGTSRDRRRRRIRRNPVPERHARPNSLEALRIWGPRAPPGGARRPAAHPAPSPRSGDFPWKQPWFSLARRVPAGPWHSRCDMRRR